MFVIPRSGMSLYSTNYVANSPSCIDEDYKGQVYIIVHNHVFNKTMCINKGDRIAQAVILPLVRCEIEEVNELTETVRDTGGLGSTGV
jgi:dUTP pyrophosphatase